MPSDKPQSKVYLTDAQHRAESEAIHKSGMSPSDFRREALRHYVESFGVEWPDDMPQLGTIKTKKKAGKS